MRRKNVSLEVCVLEAFLHDLCFSLGYISRSFEYYSVSDSLHAVLDQELERVPVLIHVEVASMYFGDYMLDIESHTELWTLLKLKDDLLEVVIAWQHCHYGRIVFLAFGDHLCDDLLFEGQYLLDEFSSLKLELISDVSLGLEVEGINSLGRNELSK